MCWKEVEHAHGELMKEITELRCALASELQAHAQDLWLLERQLADLRQERQR